MKGVPALLYDSVVKPLGRAWRGLRFVMRHGLTDLGFARALSFSQFGEDVFVYHFLKHRRTGPGLYVDIGAYHPCRFSNTYLFYKLGWKGINVEPNPKAYQELIRHRPRDITLNVAISTTRGVVDFVCDEAYSGISDGTYLFSARNPTAEIVKIETVPLSEILETYVEPGRPIDFISIDCEGHDLQVLQSNDWARFRPSLVLVEDHDPDRDSALNRLLQDLDYQYLARLHLTKIFADNRSLSASSDTAL
ncbi:hypothetical protein AWN76_015595 [Rhodothermaceae bacterium RA]|nr:hypothetical protein AWN76_015595 [Rhodothermaceae bacterium RA]